MEPLSGPETSEVSADELWRRAFESGRLSVKARALVFVGGKVREYREKLAAARTDRKWQAEEILFRAEFLDALLDAINDF